MTVTCFVENRRPGNRTPGKSCTCLRSRVQANQVLALEVQFCVRRLFQDRYTVSTLSLLLLRSCSRFDQVRSALFHRQLLYSNSSFILNHKGYFTSHSVVTTLRLLVSCHQSLVLQGRVNILALVAPCPRACHADTRPRNPRPRYPLRQSTWIRGVLCPNTGRLSNH